jgi:hypothetical protein
LFQGQRSVVPNKVIDLFDVRSFLAGYYVKDPVHPPHFIGAVFDASEELEESCRFAREQIIRWRSRADSRLVDLVMFRLGKVKEPLHSVRWREGENRRHLELVLS